MVVARLGERTLLLLAIILSQFGYSAWVGGDAWEWMGYANRYLTVVLPLAVTLAALGAERLFDSKGGRSLPRSLVAGGIGVLLLATALSSVIAPDKRPPLTPTDLMSLAAAGSRMLVGVCFLLRAVALTSGRPTWPRWKWATTAFVPTLSALLLTLSATAVSEWISGNAVHVLDDARMARLGLGLRETTTRDASIGVVWAGAIPYFSSRRSVDFLGKNDMYVARLPPRLPFIPGHNKWDYTYSVGTRRPDVIVQIRAATAEDIRFVLSEGYDRIGRRTFVLAGSPKVDRSRLTTFVTEFNLAARRRGGAQNR